MLTNNNRGTLAESARCSISPTCHLGVSEKLSQVKGVIIMSGARIIVNSRFFHIARTGEKADGKHVLTRDAAMGLVNYVGTREGVALNAFNQITFNGNDGIPLNLDPLKLSSEVASRPVTRKQFDTIAGLLHEIPEAKNSLEYQDFKEHPTIGNASELISRAAEIGLGYAVDIGKATNLVSYVANRPGVDRVGEHGLFSSSPTVDIKKAQEEIANCEGKIWTHVISLRREDADRLGWDEQKPWRDMVMQKIDVIAKASNIPVSELHWYAGMHNTTHHPHIHLFVFSDDPKVGHLNVEGINKMKSAFSEVIFADERKHIYVRKDEIRKEIKEKADDILSHLQDGTNDQFSKEDIKIISDKLLRLSAELKNRPGKMQFGWIKDLSLKEQVNSIMIDLAKAPDIQALYGLYCEDHKDLQRMYRNDPEDLDPIVKINEFKSIKNRIIREAVRIGNTLSDSDAAKIVDSSNDLKAKIDHVIGGTPELASSPSGNGESLHENIPEKKQDGILAGDFSPTPEDWAAGQTIDRENMLSLYDNIPDEGPDNTPPEDYEDCLPSEGIVQESPEPANPHDYHPKQTTFQETYIKAFDGDPKVRYQLARMYFYGDDVEQDYAQAQMWYGLAANEGYSLAKYELGKMYLYGIGIDRDVQLGNEYCYEAFQDFVDQIEHVTGINIETDSYEENELPKADSYHAYLEYLVGRMRLAGEGVERDNQLAYSWFRAASWHENVHSKYMLAKMYYDGKGIPQDYEFALNLYKEAADQEDKYACYAAGRMYFRGIGTAQNYGAAASCFVRASKENVPYADYSLAQMAESGLGMPQDETAAGILFEKALREFEGQEKQQPDALTECRIAFQYLLGKGTAVDPTKAVEWFEKAVKFENPQAEYQLAELYASGNGIDADKAKAFKLYRQALAGFLNAEKDNPEAGQEYRIAQMYEKGLGTEAVPKEIIYWLNAAAEQGHGHAAYRLGKLYLTGTYTAADPSTALKWIQEAAELEDKFAYYSLGRMYCDGVGTKQDCSLAAKWLQKASAREGQIRVRSLLAAKWLQKASDANLPFASYLLATLYYDGKGVDRNTDHAYSMYEKALSGFLELEKADPDAMLEYRIGGMYLHGKGTVGDPSEALKWFKLSAEKENAYAAYQAAELLSDGKSVPKDETQAQKYYATALTMFLQTEQNDPDAMLEYRIGGMFLDGVGTQKNPEFAFYWFSKSAENGNSYSAYLAGQLLEKASTNDMGTQYYYSKALNGFITYDLANPDDSTEFRIGQMFYRGKGTGMDLNSAYHWFSLSADKGNPYAQFQLARMFQASEWIMKDEQSAHKLYAMALQGFKKMFDTEPSADLQYKIGTMYEFGLGVEKDTAEAKHWYNAATDAGNESAEERLRQIQAFESQAAIYSVFSLFRVFARAIGNNIDDSTTHRYQQDRKLLQKERMLKIAHGQDREQEQTM
jgi:TPR repeat protein